MTFIETEPRTLKGTDLYLPIMPPSLIIDTEKTAWMDRIMSDPYKYEHELDLIRYHEDEKVRRTAIWVSECRCHFMGRHVLACKLSRKIRETAPGDRLTDLEDTQRRFADYVWNSIMGRPANSVFDYFPKSLHPLVDTLMWKLGDPRRIQRERRKTRPRIRPGFDMPPGIIMPRLANTTEIAKMECSTTKREPTPAKKRLRNKPAKDHDPAPIHKKAQR